MEVAAAIISITEITIRTGSKLWKLTNAWREAPEDLHRLRDDISRTQQFFDEVRQNAVYTSASWREDSPTQTELKRLLVDGSLIIERIEMVVDNLTGNKPSLDKLASISKMRRIVWMANSQKVAALRKELSNIVSSTCRMLVALNVSVSTAIHASLRRTQTDIESSIGNHLWDASERITSRLDQAVELSKRNIMHHMEHRIEAMESSLLDTVKKSVIKELTLHRRKSALDYCWNPYRTEYTPEEKHTGAAWASFMQHITPYNGPVSPGVRCRCECHSASRYSWAMASLRSVLGFITLSYAGRKSEKCLNPECQGHHFQDHHNVHLIYYFPTWLVRIALSVFVSSNLNGTPQLNIRIFNHIPGGQQRQNIFTAIRRDDTAAVKEMLATGQASVFDVIGASMHPPLWIAIILRRRDIIRVLLQAGADPHHQMVAYAMRSPIRVAFELSLTGDPAEAAVASLFPLTDYSYEEDYSSLQMAAIGELALDLTEALRQPRYLADINRKSADGHTPLTLAVIRGDARVVRLLLRAGADVNVLTLEGMTPVHLACRGGHLEVLRLLLQAGAPIDQFDNYSRNCLMFAAACCSARDADLQGMLSLLVSYGADVNYREPLGASVLDYACMRGTFSAVRFLIDNGANLNERDNDGEIPLFIAITRNRHAMIEYMLEHGAATTNVNDTGWSVLHWLARDGDAESMRIFTARKMRGLNTAAKDVDGKTPFALFSERIPRPGPELARIFDELLLSCDGGLEERFEDDDDEEEFVDAAESWDVDLPGKLWACLWDDDKKGEKVAAEENPEVTDKNQEKMQMRQTESA